MTLEGQLTVRVATAVVCVSMLFVYLATDKPKVKEVARLLFLASAIALFIRA